jgi:hypothetical protein
MNNHFVQTIYRIVWAIKMNKTATLEKLVQALKRLVEILQLDPSCTWTAKFQNDLAKGIELLNGKYEEDDLRSFSSSIRHVFGGMGSFNDYYPGKYDRLTGRYNRIAGTEDFEKIVKQVFDQSLELISSNRNA